MRKSLILCFLLINFIGFNAKSQSLDEQVRQRASKTICNELWLAEALIEDIQDVLGNVGATSFINTSSDLLPKRVRLFLSPWRDNNGACSTKTGNTSLHLALYVQARPEVIIYLIRAGASPFLKNYNGIAPIQLNNIEYVPLLRTMKERGLDREDIDCGLGKYAIDDRNGATYCIPHLY